MSAIWRPAPFGIAPVECLVRFWERCVNAQDALVIRNYVPLSPPASTPPAPPGRALAPAPAGYDVRVNFAGNIRREDMIGLLASLRDGGWSVPADQRRGNRTALAAKLNEVRYPTPADAAAAAILAQDIEARGVVVGPITPRLTPGLQARVLEAWISR